MKSKIRNKNSERYLAPWEKEVKWKVQKSSLWQNGLFWDNECLYCKRFRGLSTHHDLDSHDLHADCISLLKTLYMKNLLYLILFLGNSLMPLLAFINHLALLHNLPRALYVLFYFMWFCFFPHWYISLIS